jgi:acetolactate synthase I/III small subunit
MSNQMKTKTKRTLAVLVENKPGVLDRVSSLFRRRGFNIDSLTVGRTENSELSRMTIVVDGCSKRLESQLRKLINVVSIDDVTDVPNLSRDLALIKVSVNARTRAEVLQMCDIFRANVVDASPESLVLEITGNEDKIWALVEMLGPFGILEMVRTGVVAMSRGSRAVSTSEYRPRPYKNGKTPQPVLATSNGRFVV